MIINKHEEQIILVVDDNTENIKLLSKILSMEGYKIHAAVNGELALQSIKADPPDLILMDIQMPKMDGYETCRRIKDDKSFSDIPVIFISAMDETFNKVEAFKSGGVDYITKPFHPEEVLLRIKNNLNIVEYQKRLQEINFELFNQLICTFDQAAVGIAHIKPDIGKIIKANNSLCNILGYSNQEMYGLLISKLIHRNYLDIEIRNVNTLLKGMIESYSNEFLVRRKDNSYIWVRDTVSCVTDVNGKPDYLVVIIEDISERKNTEKLLKDQNKFLNNIIESLTHPFYVIDVSDFSIVLANSAAKNDMFEDGMKCYKLIHGSEIECGKLYETCTIELMKKKKEPFTLEHLHLDKKGRYRYFELHAFPLFNEKGEVYQIIQYSIDITSRRFAENILAESEKRLRLATKSGKIGIWDWDFKNNNLFWDDSMYELYNLEKSDYPSAKNAREQTLHPDDFDKIQLELEKAVSGESDYDTEFRIKTKDGKIKMIHSTAMIQSDGNDKVIRMIGVNIDVTKIRITEMNLRQSEKRLKEAQALAKIGNWEMNLITNQFFWSDEIYNILGINQKNFKLDFNNFIQLIHPDDREKFNKAYSDHKQNKKAYNIEHRVLLGDGTLKYVLQNCHSEFNNNGEAVKTVGTIQDITEKKIYEKEILKLNQELEQRVIKRTMELESEKNFIDTVINSLPGIFYTVDNKGQLRRWNKNYRELLGFEKGDLNNTFIMDTFLDSDRKKIQEAVKKALQTGFASAEGHIVSANGTNLVYYLTASQVLINEENYLVGVGFDITEKKLYEEELKKLSMAVEQNPSTVVMTDKEGRIIYVNKTFSRITGYDYKEVIGKNPSILKSGKTGKDEYKVLWDTILQGRTWKGELLNKKKNGELYWESASISPILNDNEEIICFVAVKEDITERKEMEEELKIAKERAESATKAKSDFLANMSHEIRTPMNAIIGLTHLLSRTRLTNKQRDYLNKIDQSGKNLLGIINDILDFSKIEAGKLDIETIDFNLNEIFDNLSNLISIKAQKKGIELIYAIRKEVPKYLVGDPLRITQVLLNLANNAVKFTDEGEILISCETVLYEGNGVILKFSVKDTGIGLKSDQKKKLFKAFSQADTSITRKYGGTGLGLSISKRLVEMMGGKISVKSKYKKGSDFYFTITCRVSDKKIDNNFIENKEVLNILIADDNETARLILTDYISDFNFKVTAVDSGIEAIKEVSNKNNHYHILLIDYKMPELNGLETVSKIRKLKDIEQPKIILTTAFGFEEIFNNTKDISIDGFLVKPVTQSLLFDSIMNIISNRKKNKLRTITSNILRKEYSLKGNILLVEDNEINQEVALELLEEKGLNVDIAENGKQAIEKIRKKFYNLVLMDLQMPVMDGFTATKIIRDEFPEKNLPIIAMTADAMTGVRDQVLSIGMNDYITKPIEPDKVFSILSQWLAIDQAVVKISNKDMENLSSISIPGINNINTVKGVERLNGNVKAYIKLIKKFRKNNTDLAEKVKTLIDSREFDECEKIIHSIKGVSGNINADTLYNISTKFDKALKIKNEDEIYNLFNDFINELSNVLDSIKDFELSENNDEKDNNEISTNKIEDELSYIVPMLEELSGFIEKNNMRSLEIMQKLFETITNQELMNDLKEINEKLENYEFNSGLDLLNKLMNKYYS